MTDELSNIAQIAKALGTKPKIDKVVQAIAQRMNDFDIKKFERCAILTVVSMLIQNPESLPKLRADQDITEWQRSAMEASVRAWLRGSNESTRFLNEIIAIIRMALQSDK